MKKLACAPDDFLPKTEVAGVKHITWGGKTTWRSVLLRLYQVLTTDLNFYSLCSRPYRALEKVLKNRGFKMINT
jgi:hypothetical protein